MRSAQKCKVTYKQQIRAEKRVQKLREDKDNLLIWNEIQLASCKCIVLQTSSCQSKSLFAREDVTSENCNCMSKYVQSERAYIHFVRIELSTCIGFISYILKGSDSKKSCSPPFTLFDKTFFKVIAEQQLQVFHLYCQTTTILYLKSCYTNQLNSIEITYIFTIAVYWYSCKNKIHCIYMGTSWLVLSTCCRWMRIKEQTDVDSSHHASSIFMNLTFPPRLLSLLLKLEISEASSTIWWSRLALFF